MASFALDADAVAAGLEAQTELQTRIREIGGELALKAGVRAGAYLIVNFDERFDFFGGAINTAARVQGLLHGNDVVVTEEVFTEVESAALPIIVAESFDSKLRGLPDLIHVHRLISPVSLSAVS